MSKKSTKKALLLSALAMFACVAMLIGSTFAWFTDSVTSAGNKIEAGTLKIDLELLDKNGNWSSIKESKAALFDYDLWEPGYTEVKVLKIENEGTLALQWVAQFQSEKALSALANVIDVYVLASETEIGYPADRNLAGYTKVGTVAEFVNNFAETENGTLLAGEKAYLAIALKMQESAGNEYQGLALGAFDIRIFATQYTYEKDSFDELYDDLAIVSNAADLKAAIAAGKDVILNGDIAVDAPIAVAKGVEASIDLNGHTISRVDADADKNDDGKFTSADNTCIFQVKGDLTVQGEGSIVMEHTGDNMEWNALSACFSVEAGELTLGEGVVVAHMGGTDMAYAVDVNTTLGETVLNVNGATLYSSYVGVRVFNNHKTAKGIVNYNSGIISGGSRDIWTQIMSAPAANAVVNTEIPYTTNDAGDRYYFGTTVIFDDAKALDSALNSGSDVILQDDLSFSASETANVGYAASGVFVNGGVLDGNGKTLNVTNANTTWACAVYTNGGTIKNITVSGAMRGIFTAGQSSDLYIDNVTFENVVYTFNSDDGNKNYGVYISNSKMNGWTSFSNVHKEVIFTNCSFGEGSGYAFCRPYNATAFVGCDFSEGYEIDARNTITFENCTINGQPLTAENLATLVTGNIANATVIG